MSKKQEPDIDQLTQLLKDQEVSAKMLVRRDLELSRAYEKLREFDRIKSEFISTVAHQLRTPLSVTKWAFAMLGDSTKNILTPEQTKVLNNGKESNERMIRLVDDLLNVDSHEAGKIEYSFSAVSIHDVINTVLLQAKPLALQKKISLVYTPPEETLPEIQADKEKIVAALLNLCENAIKYTPRDGTVTLVVEKKEDDILIKVQDTGIGIPKDEQEHIFGKFYRGKKALQMVTDGSGLGLFIAQKIIRRHGGTIQFESSEHAGSTFFVTIPITT